MLPLLAVAFPAVAAVIILAARIWRPRLGFAWLAAAAGSLAGWGLALAAHPDAPRILPLGSWQPRVLLPVSPILIVDGISWAFLVAVLSLNLAAVLTEVQRVPAGERPGGHPLELSFGLLLSSAAAAAVLASNLLTLMLLWTAIDLIVLVIGVQRAENSRQNQTAVMAFALRLGANWLILMAGLLANAAGTSTSLTTLTPAAGALILAAVCLRSGLAPPHRPLSGDRTPASGLHMLSILLPAAAGWLAAARVAASTTPQYAETFLWLGAGAGLYAGWSWLAQPTVREGLPYWTIGVTAIGLAGAALGHPFATTAAALSGLLLGGMLRLADTRIRSITILLLLSLPAASALPFTPTWPLAALYAPPFHPLLFVYLATQGALISGYALKIVRRAATPPSAERWIWVIYPSGLALLLAAHWVIAYRLRPGSTGGMPNWPGWIESGLSAVGLGLSVSLVAFVFRKRRPGATRVTAWIEMERVYVILGILFHNLRRLIAWVGWALEGRAGLLWALLGLALLLSLLVQVGGGTNP